MRESRFYPVKYYPPGRLAGLLKAVLYSFWILKICGALVQEISLRRVSAADGVTVYGKNTGTYTGLLDKQGGGLF